MASPPHACPADGGGTIPTRGTDVPGSEVSHRRLRGIW